jgi:hypothetical protein
MTVVEAAGLLVARERAQFVSSQATPAFERQPSW